MRILYLPVSSFSQKHASIKELEAMRGQRSAIGKRRNKVNKVESFV